MYRILLVDDEANVLSALRRILNLHGLPGRGAVSTEGFTDPAEALRRVGEQAFDLVISDYRMPGMNGVEFLKAVREIQPFASRLVLSGYADLDGLVGAINEAQIHRFIAKPWHDSELLAAIGQALAHRELLLENQRLADTVRLQQGRISRQELELRRLEEEHPGITRVHWGPNGEVIVDDGV